MSGQLSWRERANATESDVSASDRTDVSTSRTGQQTVWNYIAFVLSKASTLIMMAVLARLLSPAELGIFALALLVINLFDYVKDLGVTAALVQTPSFWGRLAPTGLTISVVFGVAVGGLVAATATPAAAALGHDSLAPLIRVLAIALAITAFSAIPSARLRRSIDFRGRLIPEFFGAFSKTVLAIGLAIAGLGVWSLIYGQLASAAVTTALYWLVAREPVRFGFDRRAASEIIRFGVPVTAVTLVAYAIYNVDYLSIGARLGDTELGLYTLAYRLPELAVLSLCVVVSDVLFSSLSRLQDNLVELGRHYQRALTVVIAITAPIGIGLAVTSNEVMHVLYGPTYAVAANELAVLALFTVVYSASFHTGDVYKAMGRPGVLTALGIAKLLVMIGPIWWAAQYSALHVAFVLLGVEVLHFGTRLVVARQIAGLSVRALLSAVFRPLTAALAMGGVLLVARYIELPVPTAVRLLALVVVGAVTYVLALCITTPTLVRQAMAAITIRKPKAFSCVIRRASPKTWATRPNKIAPNSCTPLLPRGDDDEEER